MKLVAQEQVLDHKVAPFARKSGECGEKETDQLEHRDRVADLAGLPSYSSKQHGRPGCQASFEREMESSPSL